MKQIKIITSFDECEAFVRGFCRDNAFSDPMLSNGEQIKRSLIKSIEKPKDHLVLGVFDGRQMAGLFSFLVLTEEKYLEMLAGLSCDKDAYSEMFAYLRGHFASYSADFVFSPNNRLLCQLLRRQGAEFETEQQKMVFSSPDVPHMDTSGIELLTEKYIPAYLKIHNTDLYWTGEKVIEATDRFRTFVAIEGETVVGYVDATHCFEENEPVDLLVQADHRRKGYGRKLLVKALEKNAPKKMTLLVNVDNEPAIRLYESLGFEKAENQNSITAHCKM